MNHRDCSAPRPGLSSHSCTFVARRLRESPIEPITAVRCHALSPRRKLPNLSSRPSQRRPCDLGCCRGAASGVICWPTRAADRLMEDMTAAKDRSPSSSIGTAALLDVNLHAHRLGVSQRFVRRLVDERRTASRPSRLAGLCASTPHRSTSGFEATLPSSDHQSRLSRRRIPCPDVPCPERSKLWSRCTKNVPSHQETGVVSGVERGVANCL
jgi:hypothetical protein